MRMKKATKLALPLLASFALSGCGEKDAQVVIPLLISSMKDAGEFEFVSGEVYQIPKDNYQTYLKVKSDAELAKKILLETNTNNPFTLDHITDTTIKRITATFLTTSNDRITQAHHDWLNYFAQHKIKLEAEIRQNQLDLDNSTTNFMRYKQAINAYETTVTEIKKTIEQLKNKENNIFKTYMDAINQDIDDFNLPLEKLNKINFYYYQWETSKRPCQQTRYPVFEVNGMCYELNPIDKQLLNKPSYKKGQQLLAQYLDVEHKLGPENGTQKNTAYHSLTQAKKALSDQKTIARNQYHFKFEPNDKVFEATTKKLKQRQNALIQLSSEETKLNYLANKLHDISKKMDHEIDKALRERRAKLSRDASHATVEYGNTVELDADGKRGILLYHIKETNGNLKTIIGPFDVEALNKSETPTIRSLGTKPSYMMKGHVDMNNPSVSEILFDPSVHRMLSLF